MPSKKVTELETATIPYGLNVLYVIVDTTGTPTGKQISLNTLFGNIPCNTNISQVLTVTGQTNLGNTGVQKLNVSGPSTLGATTFNANGIVIQQTLTPSNSSVTSIDPGKLFYDANYLYIRVSNNTTNSIKRIPLSSF
jgi:hypothetical protein